MASRIGALALLGAALGLALLLFLTRPAPPTPKPKPRVYRVEAVRVQPGSYAPRLKLYGRLKTEGLVRRVAPAASQVVALSVAEGQTFKRGELLLRLDPRDFESRLQEIEAEREELTQEIEKLRRQHHHLKALLSKEEALLELARRELERASSLLKRKLGSEALYDQAREKVLQRQIAVAERTFQLETLPLEIARLEARAQRLEAEADRVRALLERSVVLAPFDGVVHRLEVALGETVQPGQPLISFYDPKRLEVRAKIPAPYFAELARALAEGKGVEAEGEGFGIRFRARLDRFAAEVGRAGVEAFFEMISTEGPLWLDMPVVLWLRLPKEGALIPLPRTALYHGELVYRIRGGSLEPVSVEMVGTLGQVGGRSWILVASPKLLAGDLVLATQLPEAVAGVQVEVAQISGPPELPSSGVSPGLASEGGPGLPDERLGGDRRPPRRGPQPP